MVITIIGVSKKENTCWSWLYGRWRCWV